MTTDHISHYGVKGMKWGVRRSEAQLRRERAKSADYKQTEKLRGKAKTTGLSSLSNEQIQTVLTRMNLEANYKRLNPTVIQRGQTAVKDVLGVGATANQAINLANSPVGQTIKNTIEK